ncbi:general secretion pathway protein [Cupriavidus sp. USMAHM13]|uniref:general secretion pathway protein n=1 Tax=Cupriavidus sp. USMAHM13 TaxID=1389192 RepID=UPI000A63C26F|nr:general secretion pathway protein [Cupriavidus sp. USMAHM13]
MQLSIRPPLRIAPPGPWLPRLAGVALFVALCALATWWVLRLAALNTIPVPQSARVVQSEAVESGALGTLFGGSAQSGVRDVQLIGVVADIDNGAGAAIVSLDGGPPKAVRAGAVLSPQLRLVEIRGRAVVIERNGVRQEVLLPVQSGAVPARGAAAQPAPPAGAAAPIQTLPAAVPQPANPPAVPPPAQVEHGSEPGAAKD